MVSAPLNLIPTEKCCVTIVAKVLDLNKLWSCKYGSENEKNDK